MNLSGLRTFVAILDAGSLVKASLRLNVTQSTVTARLQSLEREVGQVLLRRDKSGVTPTASGLRLRRYAETMLELWSQARRETSLPTQISAICNLGCHPDLWFGLGEVFFDHVRTTAPDVALSVWTAGAPELDEWLRSGLIDVAISDAPGGRGRRATAALPPDRLILTSTRPNAPLRFDSGYIFIEAGEEFGRWHAAAYADADAARISFGSAALGIGHLRRHGGSAYLPRRLAGPLLATGALHPIDGAPGFERRLYLSYDDQAAGDWDWFADAAAPIGAGVGR